VLDRRAPEHLLQDTGEVLDNDDGFGARVFQLVFQLAWRVQRIDVHHDHAGAQDAEQRHGYCSRFGAMMATRSPLVMPQSLQVGSKIARQLLQLGIAYGAAEM